MTQSSDRYRRMMAEKIAGAPLCLCGCGQKTQWLIRTKSYGKYLFKHNTPNLSDKWTDRIEQIARGTSLGDGNIQLLVSRKGQPTGAARLRIRHSTKRQTQYATWLYNELKPIVHGQLRTRKTPQAYGAETIEFGTASLPQLYTIHQELYDHNGKKKVSREYLDKLTDLSTAIWWCDDGSTASLSTHSFTANEQDIIRTWFRDHYDMHVLIKMDRRVNLPYIQIPSDAMRHFGKRIFQHVHPSLYYKFARFQTHFDEWSKMTQ